MNIEGINIFITLLSLKSMKIFENKMNFNYYFIYYLKNRSKCMKIKKI